MYTIRIKNKSGFRSLSPTIIKKVFVLLPIMLVLLACKKNAHDQQKGSSTNTKRLIKITEVRGGQTMVYNFNYNAKGRLASINSDDRTENITFSYDNDGNVISVSESNFQFLSMFYYNYRNGKPVTATFKSWRVSDDAILADDFYSYTVSNQRVTKIHVEMVQPFMSLDLSVTYNTDGNVTRIEAPGVLTVSYSYGSKKPIYPNIYKYITDWSFAPRFFAQNEINVENYNGPVASNNRVTAMQYTYGPEGYVVSSTDGTTQYTYDYQ
jgi:YD repeat-containing protein